MVCGRGYRGLVWTFLQRISRPAADCRPHSIVRISARRWWRRAFCRAWRFPFLRAICFMPGRRAGWRIGRVRRDVTAIPFGVNTPTIFAYISLIMLPVYERTHDPIAYLAGRSLCQFRKRMWCRLRARSAPTGCGGTCRGRRCCVRWPESPWPFFAWVSSSACFQTPEVALLPAVMILDHLCFALALARPRIPVRAGRDGCGCDRGGCC